MAGSKGRSGRPRLPLNERKQMRDVYVHMSQETYDAIVAQMQQDGSDYMSSFCNKLIKRGLTYPGIVIASSGQPEPVHDLGIRAAQLADEARKAAEKKAERYQEEAWALRKALRMLMK